MDKLNKLALLVIIIFSYNYLYSQCNVSGTATPPVILCGESTELSVFGSALGNVIFEEDFDNGTPSGWKFTQSANFTNPCSPNGVDGTTHLWMGDAAPNPRDMETVSFDLTPGGVICFDMLFATQGDASPCEGPDEPTEGVYLQYSTDGGANWNNIHYFDPKGGNNSQLTNWNNYCFPIPAGAQTANTSIRWHQDKVTSELYDHWGIDNVVITLNDPNFGITSTHDNYNYGNQGGVNPTTVSPRQDTSYVFVMTDGTTTCTDTVHVKVKQPSVIIETKDTTICEGVCTQLNTVVKVVTDSAKTPTYANTQPDTTKDASALKDAKVNINITTLNMTNVLPGSITQVCIDEIRIKNNIIFPLQAGDIDIVLTCPDGTFIVLMPNSSASSTPSGSYNTIFQNMCFEATGPAVSSSAVPYNGTFGTNESFDNLAGCTANGLWKLSVYPSKSGAAGDVIVTGWSITFDDPEISYIPANLTWSPTTDFQNPSDVNSPQPTICPNAASGYPITYTVTAGDDNNCAQNTGNITVDIMPTCCVLDINDTTLAAPTCGNSDGSIQVVVSNASNMLTYSINDGTGYSAPQASDLFTGLGVGTYDIVVNDDTNCPDTLFNVALVSASAPTIDDTIASPSPSCGAMDGGIDVTASGGVAPLEYSSDGGATYQTSNILTGLGAGTYDVRVRDANGCEVSVQYTLNPGNGPVITNVASTPPSCGSNDGTITITASGGAGALEYSTDNGGTFSNNNIFNALGVGTYDIVVRDAGGCLANDQITLSVANGPTITNTTFTSPNCGASDGTITITASGGTAPLEYSINNGSSFDPNNVFNGLDVGTYDVVVRDVSGCAVNDQVVVTSGNSPAFDNITFVNPACGANDGEITITASGGMGALEYRINNTSAFSTTTNYIALASGTYLIEVKDDNGCIIDSLIKLNDNSNMSIALNTVNAGINCITGDNGSAVVLANGGNAPAGYRYNWSDGIAGTTDAQANNLAGGTYSITVSDDDGCSRDTTFTIQQLFPFDLPVITTESVSCEQNCDGGMTITTHPKFTLSFDNGATNLTTTQPTGLCDSIYNLMVTDTLGCDSTVQVTIGVGVQPVADFSYEQDSNGDPFNPSVVFTNESQRAYFYDWDFGVLAPPWSGEDTTLLFPLNASSAYPVCLTARDSNNCEGIVCKDVEVELVVTFYAPNTITLDGNGLNDGFLPKGIGWETLNYKLRVFDRWGVQLFESDDRTKAWNGRKDNTGKLVKEGVYVWEVELSQNEFKTQKYQGHVTVLVAQ